MKILIIEDSRLLRTTTERTLVRAGYEVITAVMESRACASQWKVDLI